MNLNVEIGTEILPNDPKWKWDPKNPVTGTTKFYVRVAEALAKRGHFVRVVRDDSEILEHNRVQYVPRNTGHLKPDLVIDCNLQRKPPGKKNFQWTSFYGRYDSCIGEGYDRLLLVTDFVHSTLAPYAKCPVSVVELGCEMPVVAEPALESRPKRCCYTSSPDRGGNFLKQMWGEVQVATGYELVFAPYNDSVTNEQMQSIYDQSRFWLFPAIGTDSILSTLEAQARGCIPFYVPHMGLPETCRYGIETDLFKFKEDLIETLKRSETKPGFLIEWSHRRDDGLHKKPIPTWDSVANKILELM